MQCYTKVIFIRHTQVFAFINDRTNWCSGRIGSLSEMKYVGASGEQSGQISAFFLKNVNVYTILLKELPTVFMSGKVLQRRTPLIFDFTVPWQLQLIVTSWLTILLNLLFSYIV